MARTPDSATAAPTANGEQATAAAAPCGRLRPSPAALGGVHQP